MPVKSFTLNVNKNLGEDFVLGSTEPADWINQRISFTGSLTFKYDNATWRALGLADTEKAIRFKLAQGDWVWQFDFPSASFIDHTRDENNDAYMLNTIGFEITRTDETNGAVKMLLTTA